MRAAAAARKTAFGEVELTIPYRGGEELREALKSEIPGRFLRWDPDDKVWRVMGAYREAAVDLLLEHFPNAEIPGDRVRPGRLVARTERPPTPLPPLPAFVEDASPEPPRSSSGRLMVSVACPKCHKRHDQPIRVVVQTSATIAKHEAITPELIAVCPNCNTLAVVAFWPAAALASS